MYMCVCEDVYTRTCELHVSVYVERGQHVPDLETIMSQLTQTACNSADLNILCWIHTY